MDKFKIIYSCHLNAWLSFLQFECLCGTYNIYQSKFKLGSCEVYQVQIVLKDAKNGGFTINTYKNYYTMLIEKK